MNPESGNWAQALVTFILGGGLFALYREIRDRWIERKTAQALAPEKRAQAESRMVATAESVVELVEERMTAQAAEIKEQAAALKTLRANYDEQLADLRKRVDRADARADRAERRVETLTRLIRTNAPHIEIPPEETS